MALPTPIPNKTLLPGFWKHLWEVATRLSSPIPIPGQLSPFWRPLPLFHLSCILWKETIGIRISSTAYIDSSTQVLLPVWPRRGKISFLDSFQKLFPVLGTVLFLFKCYYRHWDSAPQSYTTRLHRGGGEDARRDTASSCADPTRRRTFGARALGGKGTPRSSPQVRGAACPLSDPYGTEQGWSIWEWLSQTSHRTVIKNIERVTADFVRTSRDGNTYKQTFHSLERGMKVHCVCLDYSGQGCAQKPTHLGRSEVFLKKNTKKQQTNKPGLH